MNIFEKLFKLMVIYNELNALKIDALVLKEKLKDKSNDEIFKNEEFQNLLKRGMQVKIELVKLQRE